MVVSPGLPYIAPALLASFNFHDAYGCHMVVPPGLPDLLIYLSSVACFLQLPRRVRVSRRVFTFFLLVLLGLTSYLECI